MTIFAISAACARVPAADAEPPANSEGSCDAAKAQQLVGRTATEAVKAAALRLSGARNVRVIPKDGVVTMDYREDRLNLYLDGAKKVERISCG
jgi:hypothetical protein